LAAETALSKSTKRGIFAARVLRNTRLCTEHYRLTLGLDYFPASQPGQFVQVACRPEDEHCGPPGQRDLPAGGRLCDADLAEPLAFLRRPFSIAGRRDRPDATVEIDIIHRVVGKGTRYLETLAEGAPVDLLGPLGRGFWLPEDMTLGLMVGGGVGVPPMLYLAELLAHEHAAAVGLVGAQRKDLVALTWPPGCAAPAADGRPVMNAQEFARFGFPTVITTDDGSLGMKGFVTDALRRLVEAQVDRRGVVVFCCGPTPMMRATARLCADLDVRCLVSLEQPMACGMGTCQSCVVRWQGPQMDQWAYRLTCTDGPVFDAREIVWEKS
jgi:dihydroorotate dehydrogenase electron transfer subunit